MRPTHPIRSLALAAVLVAVALACAPRPLAAEEPKAPDAATVERIRAAVSGWFAVPVPAPREITSHVLHPEDASRAIELRGAFPNPFRSETAIRFAVPAPTRVQVRMFDVTGRLVRTLVDAQLPAGDHSAMVRADGLNPGVYWVRLQAGAVAATRRVVLMR
jgi:hypothetical protein